MTADRVEAIAREIERRGLSAPALVLLEAHRPLRPLLALGATFLMPVARPLLGGVAEGLRELVDNDGEYGRLVDRLSEDQA